MDEYTNKTKIWLDNRFQSTDKTGIYEAHQPIYGFRKGHCEPVVMERYIRTFQILKALSRAKFETFIDIGGAEGYKAYLVKTLLGPKVVSADLSSEACKRAKEIFKIDTVVADIHELPFKEQEFDMVLCSETLEHVADYRTASKELLRIARKGVVITLPHESKAMVDSNIRAGSPHAHIHEFDIRSFDYLKKEGYRVIAIKMFNPIFGILYRTLIDSIPLEEGYKRPRWLVSFYNKLIKVTRFMFGKRTAKTLIFLDQFICRLLPGYRAILFMIFKDNDSLFQGGIKQITPSLIVDFAVPFHYLNKQNN